MDVQDIIGVLQKVRRREVRDNEKINRLCTNPSDSIGAKAIDAAIKILEMFLSTGLTPERCAELAAADTEGRLVVREGNCNSCYYKLESEAWKYYTYPCSECQQRTLDHFVRALPEAALRERQGRE